MILAPLVFDLDWDRPTNVAPPAPAARFSRAVEIAAATGLPAWQVREALAAGRTEADLRGLVQRGGAR